MVAENCKNFHIEDAFLTELEAAGFFSLKKVLLYFNLYIQRDAFWYQNSDLFKKKTIKVTKPTKRIQLRVSSS